MRIYCISAYAFHTVFKLRVLFLSVFGSMVDRFVHLLLSLCIGEPVQEFR